MTVMVDDDSAKVTADDMKKIYEDLNKDVEEKLMAEESLLEDARNRAKRLLEDYVKNIGEAIGKEYTVNEVAAKIISCKNYLRNGGVTLSGGEPLLQKEFTLELLKKLKEENIKSFDFTKFELEYIIENANFNEEQEQIFKLLTSRQGRQSIINISIRMNMSESTVKRKIKQIITINYDSL